MQTKLLHIQEKPLPDIVEAVLTFKSFTEYLRQKTSEEKTIKKQFNQYVLDLFEKEPAFTGIIGEDEAAGRQDLLELVYASLTPGISDEKELLWALSNAVPKNIFYCTDAFAAFSKSISLNDQATFQKNVNVTKTHKYEYVYSMIMRKFYGFNIDVKSEMIYTYSDPSTSLNRYFRIDADTRFVDIKLKGKLPELNLSDLEPYLQETDDIELITRLVPLDLFRFEGFSVITFTDFTAKYSIDSIRNAILGHSANSKELHTKVIDSLKTLAGDNQIEFGLLPFLKLNGRPVFESNNCSQSLLMQSAWQEEAGKTFDLLIDQYLESPRTLFFGVLDEEKVAQFPFLKKLFDDHVMSYAIIPIYYNMHLAGIMEIYSRQRVIPFEETLSAIEPAFTLIGQLLQNCSDEFNSRIESVIKRKFTSLQPSVQWKFNEAAWNYLKLKRMVGEKHEIETITFNHVYPLYGAVDIRESTVERNRAFREDSTSLLQALQKALITLKKQHHLTLIDELVYQCGKWLNRVSDNITTNDEILLSQFFERDVEPFLAHFKTAYPGTSDLLREYEAATDESWGTGFARRRDLEASIRLINVSVNNYLDQVQAELQESYPCYFEKFRTDGVEYDIYIGQSIAPHHPFNLLYLKNLRLWQLRSMAELARLTNSLLTQTPIPLQTTQLIFVHTTPIDISFRNDERRFDVEGAYNIRYEIIKKRIDKVSIKGSSERLTQPGKIALVYFNDREMEEYLQFISYLQEQGYLGKPIEFLELDELQGVSGLKAIRVSVLFN
ncbi:GAF domain-containing protein [Pararcticibacter amylolyticus]|uniref:GAF domain-containing protein n=1 Tax=Pararcticibacter amylolyticus TaxID=2173175 RepID=A0A2U2PKH4_9SPHI|nr:GAF domain-containing protein [Pararcticibacter amylolyticus]PWG81772.1 GAF domain-containing protein [Pararcticibacter amylolyticus]